VLKGRGNSTKMPHHNSYTGESRGALRGNSQKGGVGAKNHKKKATRTFRGSKALPSLALRKTWKEPRVRTAQLIWASELNRAGKK